MHQEQSGGKRWSYSSDEFGRSYGGPMMWVLVGDARHIIIDKVIFLSLISQDASCFQCFLLSNFAL